MEWVDEFLNKFGGDVELLNLVKSRLHGSLEINFCNGIPVNYNLKIHREYNKSDLNKKEDR